MLSSEIRSLASSLAHHRLRGGAAKPWGMTLRSSPPPLTKSRCVSMSPAVPVCSSSTGAWRSTAPCRLWWGYKESDLHRLARPRPWWENIALVTVTVGIVVVSAITYYFGNRLYYKIRPQGDDMYVIQRLDEKVFSRPDLSVALIRMTLHHIFSRTNTPFAAPMVAPPELAEEARELLSFIKGLHAEQPQFSIPDLWALTCAKAVERLGGPIVAELRGRANQASVDDAELLKIVPSQLSDGSRDVLALKKLFAVQGFSCDEAVAALAGSRNIGFHAAYHQKLLSSDPMKPARMRERYDPAIPSQETTITRANNTVRKCSLDPYVFGGEYFNQLLDFFWDPVAAATVEGDGSGSSVSESATQRILSWFGRSSSSSTAPRPGEAVLYRCSEDRRRRTEVLINPLSETYVTEQKIKSDMTARELREYEAAKEAADKENGAPPKVPLCDQVTLEGIDVMLLDDLMTVGWITKFSENELRFYSSFAKVMEKILSRGYNINELVNVKI